MKKNNNRVYFVLIMLIIFAEIIPATRKIISLGIITISKPITSSFSSVAKSSHGIMAGIFEISSLRKENANLVGKIKQFQVDTVKLEELEHENTVLKNQLGFWEEHKDLDLIPARIIGKEPFGATDKIIIDKGETDGIKEKTAVLSNGSMVGKVLEVYENQSKVTLITSKDSIVQAMLQKSRSLGIIKGNLDGVKLENIPQDTIVEANEAIVTSGLGGEIAPGILIGWAKGDLSTESEIYKELNVELAEDITKLEYIFIVK